jgi:DinB superfamily
LEVPGNRIATFASNLSEAQKSEMSMQGQPRQQMVELFGRGPALLAEALRRCPKKMWLYRPTVSRWSIHEIILHLADSEAYAYICCRQFIAEPGSGAAEHDASAWASSLGYFHQSTREALGLIWRLRKMTHQILCFVPDSVWAHTTQVPTKGTMTLDHWLDLQANHIPHHVDQIQQNLVDWLKTHRQRKPATRLTRTTAAEQVVLAPLV